MHLKKKRKTCARDSKDEPSELYATYKKPDTYEEFLQSISEACAKGEDEAKSTMSTLAPDMENKLKDVNRWENPHLAIETRHSNIAIISNKKDIKVNSPIPHGEIINAILGPRNSAQTPIVDSEMHPDTDSAYANFITDICAEDDQLVSRKNIRSILKGLQPYRERPSKDRSRRFIAGDLPFDQSVPSEHDLYNYSYWGIKPATSSLQNARLFLLGQVVYISEDGKPVDSSLMNCSNTSVMLDIYKYDTEVKVYIISGCSALLKSHSTLIANVTDFIKASSDHVELDHTVSPLIEYEPFHDELDLDFIISTITNVDEEKETGELCEVEKIIKKRFNAQKTQYEYLVKWVGYASSENTWELPSNIHLASLMHMKEACWLILVLRKNHNGQD